MTVRIGLIGAGGMGRAHVERIENELAGGRIVAVADLNLEGARAVAEPLGAKAYGSGAELIADPDVDAVLIENDDAARSGNGPSSPGLVEGDGAQDRFGGGGHSRQTGRQGGG